MISKSLQWLVWVLVVMPWVGHSQCVAPYYDFQGQFYAYEDGETHFIEPQKPASVQTGRYYMAFVNGNQTRLRLYYSGKTYTIVENAAEYHATDGLFSYKSYSNIGVLYENQVKIIERLANDQWWYDDSILAWTSNINDLKVFYNGEVKTVENLPPQLIDPDNAAAGYKCKIGDNILAYIDRSGYLKTYYHGSLRVVETYEPTTWLVDRDLIAYIDNIGNWKFYYKGQPYETAINNTSAYWTGEGFLAYYTVLGQLAIWYDGAEQILSQDRAKDILVHENMIGYTDMGNNFYVWYQGKKTLLDRIQPQEMKSDRHILVYKDQYGRLQGFYYGKPVHVSDQIVQGWDLFNETVVYNLVQGEVRFWCRDKTDIHEF
jgi:hypothetical protein